MSSVGMKPALPPKTKSMEEEDEWETDPNFVVIISNFN
jgi:hypothetical protein